MHDIRKYREILCEWVELQDLVRRKSLSPQQPITMNDVIMLQCLLSFSKPNVPQNFKPNVPQNFKPNVPQDFKPNVPQNFKPNVPQNFKPNVPEDLTNCDKQ